MPTMSDAVDRNLRKPWEMVRDREVAMLHFTRSQRVGRDLATGRRQQWQLYPPDLVV